MARTFIALGGNLGPVEQNFQKAISLLDQFRGSKVIQVSTIITSHPVGASSGNLFRNAVLSLETNLEPLDLLKSLQEIEASFGRDRSVRWGPRPVDLDIILYGEQVVELPDLIIPHPACWYRRFVLLPMAEIAPDVTHPLKKRTFLELKEWFEKKELHIQLAGGENHLRTKLIKELETEFPKIKFDERNQADKKLSETPVLVIWLGEDENQQHVFENLPEVSRLDLSAHHEKTLERIIEVVQSVISA
jgi:2-amino-4-hydroxy-6-hydroxymethyldihydropteridine diphosphokinase